MSDLASVPTSSSRRSCIDGPDFICIGMIKAGTGWLYDQLKDHPDFWMPPVKEIRYLVGDAPQMKVVKKRWRRFQEASKQDCPKPRRVAETKGQWLHEAIALSGREMNFGDYRSLFRHKDGLLSGDISPAYSSLGDEAVSRIAENLQGTKIVLLVRDPVARAWSGISMQHRHGKFDAALLDQPEDFRAYFKAAIKKEQRSFPSRIVERWRQFAPYMQFRHFFFDDIEQQPENVRREILVYLSADPERRAARAPGRNRKARFKKLALPDPIRAVLVDHFADELRASAKVLGGHANAWVAKYGV